MSLPEIKRAIAKLPLRARRHLRAHLATLDRRPKSAFRRKIVPKAGSLEAACLSANQDPVLCQEIESWQAFDDTPAHS
jgi:hypothetical protein